MAGKTTAAAEMEVARYVSEKLLVPSVYMMGDPEKIRYHRDASSSLLTQDELEKRYDAGDFSISDMFVLKALFSYSFAPTDAVMELVNFWSRRETLEAAKAGRPKRAIPYIEHYSDTWKTLSTLVRARLCEKFAFYPISPKPGRENKPEEIFKVGGASIRMCRKVLNDKVTKYDPADAFCNPEDAFAYALNAATIAGFLKSPFIRDLAFKQLIKIDGVTHKINCVMTMNPEGYDGDESNDTRLIFEGVTFQSNQFVVTKQSRYETVSERIVELANVAQAWNQETNTYIVFTVEDAAGLESLINVIYEKAPLISDRCIFTSGNVIYASQCETHPENLKKCFVRMNIKEGGSGFSVGGVAGHYFLDIDNSEVTELI